MSTIRLGLSFLEVPDGELPGPPRAHVFVKTFSLAAFRSIEGAHPISAECVTFSEMEYQIDGLKRELEVIKAEARRKFAAAGRREEERWAIRQRGRK